MQPTVIVPPCGSCHPSVKSGCSHVLCACRMFLVGLTGGIASGKSTVSSILRELGCPIIDADVVARQGTEPTTQTTICFFVLLPTCGCVIQ